MPLDNWSIWLYIKFPAIKNKNPINCTILKCSLWQWFTKGSIKNAQIVIVLIGSVIDLAPAEAIFVTVTPVKLIEQDPKSIGFFPVR